LKTYQDLEAVGLEELNRIEFILAAISEHQNSDMYRIAKDAEAYYRHENPRIMRLQKLIYDVLGRAVNDPFAANNKIPSRYYFYFVNQEVEYLLGNGVNFKEESTKDKLGSSFDFDIKSIAVKALNAGAAFGYWNLDHLELLPVCGSNGEVSFVPLYDEMTGALRAGIRYWQIDPRKPLRCTLFEVDGVTEYIREAGEPMRVFEPKHAYKQIVRTSATGTEITSGGNYDGFPIIPMYNVNRQSELVGSRNTIDAYDLMLSGLVNNVDEGNLIYWVIQNAGGMTDADDQRFVDRLRTLHVVHTDDQEQVTSHAVEASFQPSQAALEELRNRLFEDFMALDVKGIASGTATATQIKAAYEPMLIKSNLFEAQVSRFVLALLKLLGIKDEPSYTRDTIVNKAEEVNTLIAASQNLSDEYVTKKILTVLGDVDLYEDVEMQKANQSVERFTSFGGDE